MTNRPALSLRFTAATLMCLSGLGQIAALWLRELTGTALVDGLLGTVYLVIGIGLFGTPVWFALAWLFSGNVAWLFFACGIAYFLNYEVLHLAYHLPEQHWLARSRLVSKLRWLHALHHDPRRMATSNFNISYPLCDWLFGTLVNADAGDSVRDSRPA